MSMWRCLVAADMPAPHRLAVWQVVWLGVALSHGPTQPVLVYSKNSSLQVQWINELARHSDRILHNTCIIQSLILCYLRFFFFSFFSIIYQIYRFFYGFNLMNLPDAVAMATGTSAYVYMYILQLCSQHSDHIIKISWLSNCEHIKYVCSYVITSCVSRISSLILPSGYLALCITWRQPDMCPYSHTQSRLRTCNSFTIQHV